MRFNNVHRETARKSIGQGAFHAARRHLADVLTTLLALETTMKGNLYSSPQIFRPPHSQAQASNIRLSLRVSVLIVKLCRHCTQLHRFASRNSAGDSCELILLPDSEIFINRQHRVYSVQNLDFEWKFSERINRLESKF